MLLTDLRSRASIKNCPECPTCPRVVHLPRGGARDETTFSYSLREYIPIDLTHCVTLSFVIGLLIAVGPVAYSQVPASTAGEMRNASGSQVSPAKREIAFGFLLEGQRYLLLVERLRTRAAIESNIGKAKRAFQNAVDADPMLAEAYTALAEVAVTSPPNDIEEGMRLASNAVKANPGNIGGRRLLARLATVKSGLNRTTINNEYSAVAVREWTEITRGDPRNAEAWAFLSAFHEAAGRTDDNIGALKKWISASPAAEIQFYRRIMGENAELTPEAASVKLGSALISAGRPDEAVKVLCEMITEDGDNDGAIVLLRDAIESSDTGFSANSLRSIQNAALAVPGSLPLIKLLADLYVGANRFDDAEKLLRASIQSSAKTDKAKSSMWLMSLGDLFTDNGRYDDGIAAFDEALRQRGIGDSGPAGALDREFVKDAFAKLIRAHRQLGHNASVVAVTERARRLFGKDDLFADRQLIAHYRAVGSRQKALDIIRSVRSRNPKDQSFARLEASVLTELGDVEKAVDVIRTVASVAGSGTSLSESFPTPSLFDEFSNLLFISGLYCDAKLGKEAVLFAERAIAAAGDPDRKQIALLSLASALKIAGDFAGAEKTLRDLVKQTPGNPIALNNLGYFLAERGEHLSEAIIFIREALKVEPANPSYLDSLGWAYFKSGKLADAEKYLRRAARLNGDSVTIHEHLGDVLALSGNLSEARIAWQHALILAVGNADTVRLRDKLR